MQKKKNTGNRNYTRHLFYNKRKSKRSMQTVDDSRKGRTVRIIRRRKKKWKCFSFSIRSSVVFNFVDYFISDFCREYYSPPFYGFSKIKPFYDWTECVNIILTEKLVQSILKQK